MRFLRTHLSFRILAKSADAVHFRGCFVDGGSDFGVPSTLEAVFVDGKLFLGVPDLPMLSTFRGYFMDGGSDFGIPSTFRGFFVDGKSSLKVSSTFWG